MADAAAMVWNYSAGRAPNGSLGYRGAHQTRLVFALMALSPIGWRYCVAMGGFGANRRPAFSRQRLGTNTSIHPVI
ncbi:hypothetical protein F4W66_21590 [Escherichia coli]|nr:hypothetical protein F4W66_21590 [Escherichia coli]